MGGITSVTTVGARCPLCGSPVLSLGAGGQVIVLDARAIQLGSDLGRGYTLCDDCGLLADLPVSSTLN